MYTNSAADLSGLPMLTSGTLDYKKTSNPKADVNKLTELTLKAARPVIINEGEGIAQDLLNQYENMPTEVQNDPKIKARFKNLMDNALELMQIERDEINMIKNGYQ